MPYFANRAAHDGKFTTKFFLRISALISLAVGVIAGVVNNDAYWQTTYIEFFSEPWAVSLVWNLVWLGIMAKRKRPIVPSVIVAFDLISWVLFTLAAFMGWFAYAFLRDGVFIAHEVHDYYTSSADSVVGSCLTASTFALTSVVLHFWLFVLGCSDENRRRKGLKATATAKMIDDSGNEGDEEDVVAPSQTAVQPTTTKCKCNSSNKKLGRRGRHAIVNCVDCQTPVEIRCAHCAAIYAAKNNRDLDVPPYYGPGAVVTDLESGGLNEKSAEAVISPDLR